MVWLWTPCVWRHHSEVRFSWLLSETGNPTGNARERSRTTGRARAHLTAISTGRAQGASDGSMGLGLMLEHTLIHFKTVKSYVRFTI